MFQHHPSTFCSRVSPGTGDPVLLGRGEVSARPVLDGSWLIAYDLSVLEFLLETFTFLFDVVELSCLAADLVA